jgi:hypothetical protein
MGLGRRVRAEIYRVLLADRETRRVSESREAYDAGRLKETVDNLLRMHRMIAYDG